MLTNSDHAFCPELLPIQLWIYFPKQLNRAAAALSATAPGQFKVSQYRPVSKQRFHELTGI